MLQKWWDGMTIGSGKNAWVAWTLSQNCVNSSAVPTWFGLGSWIKDDSEHSHKEKRVFSGVDFGAHPHQNAIIFGY